MTFNYMHLPRNNLQIRFYFSVPWSLWQGNEYRHTRWVIQRLQNLHIIIHPAFYNAENTAVDRPVSAGLVHIGFPGHAFCTQLFMPSITVTYVYVDAL